MSRSAFVVYGATGYTGRLIVARARQRGLSPLLAGRDRNALAAMSAELGLDHECVPLTDPARLRELAGAAALVLNAAGPFSVTSPPWTDVCLATGTHYIDVTGEVACIESAAGTHEIAKKKNVMIMPAVGFDVVPSDCLSAHVARRLPGAGTLRLGLDGMSLLSRGSAKTIVEQLGRGVYVRKNGQLVSAPPGQLEHDFDYGRGPRRGLAVSWGDVSSAYFSTGIPNIEVYFTATAQLRAALAVSRYGGWLLSLPPYQAFLKQQARWLSQGPDQDLREKSVVTIVAEATTAKGRSVRSRLRTRDVYSTTAVTAVAVAERILAGDLRPGFQTPSRVYGSDFLCGVEGISREDL